MADDTQRNEQNVEGTWSLLAFCAFGVVAVLVLGHIALTLLGR